MSLRFRSYELELGVGGQRLGCKFVLDDGTIQLVSESEIALEIEAVMASLGSPSEELRRFVKGS
jgi:hypothetical protein